MVSFRDVIMCTYTHTLNELLHYPLLRVKYKWQVGIYHINIVIEVTIMPATALLPSACHLAAGTHCHQCIDLSPQLT